MHGSTRSVWISPSVEAKKMEIVHVPPRDCKICQKSRNRTVYVLQSTRLRRGKRLWPIARTVDTTAAKNVFSERTYIFSAEVCQKKKVRQMSPILEDSFSAVSKPILGSENLFCICPPVVCHLNQLIQLFLPWKELLFHECLQQSCERLLLFSKLCKS